MSSSSSVQLSSGQTVPMVGLGTLRSGKDVVREAVKTAIRQGYRLIDCAEVYGNEHEVGDALHEVIAEGLVRRDELTIVGKVFNHHHHTEGQNRVREACEASVAALKSGPIDLYLMHWPFSFRGATLPKEGLRLPDGRPRPELEIRVEFLQTWAEMVKLKRAGLVKALGVSNFTQEQLQALMEASDEWPVVNQIEHHPYLHQKSLLDFCRAAGIRVMAYSPLGAGAPAQGHSLLEHPTVLALAARHQRSPAQVLVRWNVQLGCICIPKSTNAQRMAANLDTFSWALATEEMEQLASLNLGHRFTRGFVEGQWFDPGELGAGRPAARL